MERASRRRFTGAYKLRILQEAEACSEPVEVEALLRREGLYISQLSAWRKQRDEGAGRGLKPSRGHPKAAPLVAEIQALRKRSERAEAELAKARKMIEVQGKVSALLDELLVPGSADPERKHGR